MRRNARTVLVVEDDYLQAQEIGRFIRGTGGEVLGPTGTVRQAASLIPHAQAAVLDIDLSGELVFPLADQLVSRGVPIVFYTGWTNTAQMPRRFWGVPLVRKPIQNIKDAAIVALTANTVGTNEDIKTILPKLRVAARLILRRPRNIRRF
ncbi:hypothetical protein [Brevirhabdus sp.]|uniref:hypothetical protein n=1 Tax=Brevirhabdus sp. TaxID=2004514 RepID=UPI00405995E7